MLAWIAPVIVLGLVVFVHEFGHFIAAKALGVYAPRFSLGWGKPLLRWRRRGSETEYVISALPIGGYVRMASKADETAAVLEGGGETVPEGAELGPHWDPEAMVPHGPKPVPADRWFESKPTWARVIILFAGVTMNAVLTIVISTSVYAYYGRRDAPAVIDTVIVGRPAALAGMQPGDSVVAVNGVAIRGWAELFDKISSSPGQPLNLEIARGEKGATRLTLAVTPAADTAADPATGRAVRVGRIGVGPLNGDKLDGRMLREPMSLAAAGANGWRATWQMGGSVVGVLGGLLRGTVSVKNLGGPIQIAQVSVAAAKSGPEALLTLIAFLSINLAVLNLLPVPILDGGQILITIAEGAMGKAFSDRTKENLMKVGLAAIAALFLIVMFNDIKALFS
jgi:regulator of sigma E protease